MLSQKSITFKYIYYIKLQNCWNYNYISQKYCFYCIFNQINATLVSIRTFFQKHSNLPDPLLFLIVLNCTTLTFCFWAFCLVDCCPDLSSGWFGPENERCDGLQCRKLCHCLCCYGGEWFFIVFIRATFQVCFFFFSFPTTVKGLFYLRFLVCSFSLQQEICFRVSNTWVNSLHEFQDACVKWSGM